MSGTLEILYWQMWAQLVLGPMGPMGGWVTRNQWMLVNILLTVEQAKIFSIIFLMFPLDPSSQRIHWCQLLWGKKCIDKRRDNKLKTLYGYMKFWHFGFQPTQKSSMRGQNLAYEALHRLDYTLDPKETISQDHCLNKLDIKLSFVYYIILS